MLATMHMHARMFTRRCPCHPPPTRSVFLEQDKGSGPAVVAQQDPQLPQGFYPTQPPIPILPGDKLRMTCLFNSQDRVRGCVVLRRMGGRVSRWAVAGRVREWVGRAPRMLLMFPALPLPCPARYPCRPPPCLPATHPSTRCATCTSWCTARCPSSSFA